MTKIPYFAALVLSSSAMAQNGACCLYDFLGTCFEIDETACLTIDGCFMSSETCLSADCSAYASCVGGGIGAIFADTQQFVGFTPIPPGTEIQYYCLLSFNGAGSSCMSLIEGDLTITFPNGDQQMLLDNHSEPITNCKSIVVISDTYITSLDDIAPNGALKAFLDYGHTVRIVQDNPSFLNGPETANTVGLGFPTNLIGAQAACIPQDISRDGRVDIYDLMIAIENFGLVQPSVDCNEDGIINIIDLIEIIVNWDNSCEQNSILQPPYVPQHGAWSSYKIKIFGKQNAEHEYSIINQN